MKCTHEGCTAWSLVKETRGNKRRRECANGHRFTTIEITVEQVRDRAVARRMSIARQTLQDMGILKPATD